MMSGKALQGQQQQVDMTNFHYYDNLVRSIRQTGRILLDLIPHIYDSQRVLRIIGEDGKGEMVTLNERTVDELGVEKILNDVTVGQYDVVMETGPGYNSKRQEAVDSMMTLLTADPALMQQAGDLIFRNMDFPGADIVADRLAAANPLAQIDEKSDIPPQVQMQLAQAQKMIQDLEQQNQALVQDLKYREGVTNMREEAATRRELMKQVARADEVEKTLEMKKYDVELRTDTQAQDSVLDNETRKEIELLKAQVAIMLSKMDNKGANEATNEAVERAI
jgi:hypothetical protein